MANILFYPLNHLLCSLSAPIVEERNGHVNAYDKHERPKAPGIYSAVVGPSVLTTGCVMVLGDAPITFAKAAQSHNGSVWVCHYGTAQYIAENPSGRGTSSPQSHQTETKPPSAPASN